MYTPPSNRPGISRVDESIWLPSTGSWEHASFNNYSQLAHLPASLPSDDTLSLLFKSIPGMIAGKFCEATVSAQKW